MIRSLRQSRFLTLSCLLVQLVLPGALGVIDAIRAEEGRGPPIHIEEKSGPQCQPSHTDECLICRYLSMGFTKPSAAPVLGAQISRSQPAVSSEASPPSGSRLGFYSRGPPDTIA
jgi:hypothetical protein